ncbi:hypothetical protein BS47DRAFT_1366176 [Hydnum rufescens UP504]|uniref:Uncharacterized protein n=1 Tax=Hydnum rufescens UP504 TaxID=1448309 RepID=A0A9P6DML8_9AGAM|nr:hypothetical protein BS47DRAFT_1366176 [Hydnum rufescens UP504]
MAKCPTSRCLATRAEEWLEVPSFNMTFSHTIPYWVKEFAEAKWDLNVHVTLRLDDQEDPLTLILQATLSSSVTLYMEITSCLDLALEGYQDPQTTLPISVYQFLSTWMKFSPSEYYTYYFEESIDTSSWMLQEDLMHNIQLSVSTLELVIKDAVALMGGEKQHFVVDVDLQYQLKLRSAGSIEEIKIADKLLKLRVELTLACLVKLKALHDGVELSGKSPMGSLSSLPPMPDLLKRLHQAWMDPHQPHHKISHRATDLGWDTL